MLKMAFTLAQQILVRCASTPTDYELEKLDFLEQYLCLFERIYEYQARCTPRESCAQQLEIMK